MAAFVDEAVCPHNAPVVDRQRIDVSARRLQLRGHGADLAAVVFSTPLAAPVFGVPA